MQSLQFHLMMKFGNHHHHKLMQTYTCIIWQPRTLPKPMEWMFFQNTRCHFHWKMYLSLNHDLNPVRENHWLSIPPLTWIALKPVWTPELQNQDVNLVILLNCRPGNAGNTHPITFWALWNSQQLWSYKSRRKSGRAPLLKSPISVQMTLPQADPRGPRGRPQEKYPG